MRESQPRCLGGASDLFRHRQPSGGGFRAVGQLEEDHHDHRQDGAFRHLDDQHLPGIFTNPDNEIVADRLETIGDLADV